MTRKRSVWLGVLAAIPISLAAQDRLRTMPGYEQAQRVAREEPVVRGGALSATWIDANAFEARVLQHELDHLDGILFLDRIASKQDLFRRKSYG